MEGLLGLTKSINTAESAIRDLSVLERMDRRIQQDKLLEVQAQKEEQAFVEQMYQVADTFLEKDRRKINKKILLSQKQLREELNFAGGSKKQFLEKGGLSILNNIKNSIIRSDEAITYSQNQKNLAKILEAKEKGLGHLLAPKDLKSLEEYENNENGGKITYSGIMAEIEIPPSQNFDYGTDIPLEKIISYKSNAIKLRQNYAINYPDDPNPSMAKLMAFAKEMGYGGTGSNTFLLRQRLIEKLKKYRSEYNSSTSKSKNKKEKISLLNELNVLKTSLPQNLTLGDLLNENKYNGSVFEHLKKTNNAARKIIGDKTNFTSRKRALSENGLEITDVTVDWMRNIGEDLLNDKFGLKDSYRILEGNEGKIVKRLFGKDEGGLGYDIQDGKILNFVPTEDMYRMDGVKITGNNKLNEEDAKGNYTVVGITTALKGKMNSDNGGEEALLINAYNDDDTINIESTSKIDKGYDEKTNIQGSIVLVLKDENDNLFYKELDISRPDIRTVLNNAMGSDNNLYEEVSAENKSVQDLRKISSNTKEEKIKLEGAYKTLNGSVFKDPLFEKEGEKYYGSGSAGQLNRYPLMKSFYMAFDYINNSYKRDEKNPEGDPNIYPQSIQELIDNQLFSTYSEIGGINDLLKDYETQGLNNEKIIKNWLEKINEDLDENSLSYKRNQEFASKWLQLSDFTE